MIASPLWPVRLAAAPALVRWARWALALVAASAAAGFALVALRSWRRHDPTPVYPNTYGVRLAPLSRSEHREYAARLARIEATAWADLAGA